MKIQQFKFSCKKKMMKYNYSSNTKLINNETFYFEKNIYSFLNGKSWALYWLTMVDYGMHADFYRACSIAAINKLTLMIQLFKEAQATIHQAKLIDFNSVKFSRKAVKRWLFIIWIAGVAIGLKTICLILCYKPASFAPPLIKIN